MPRGYGLNAGAPNRAAAMPTARATARSGAFPSSPSARSLPSVRQVALARAPTTIERLSLSIPGRTPEAGERIVQRVTEQLALRLPPGVSGRFERLELRLHHTNTSEFSISEAIVSAIVASLEKRSSHSPEQTGTAVSRG